jgi:branched-subunit amino acid transport protein
MPFLAVAALAAVTYAFRIAGPLLTGRVTIPDAAQRLFTSAAAVLLMALATPSALFTNHDFAGWARPAGVLVAGALAARRAPFPVVVLVAASVTALLRLAGIQLSERTRGVSGADVPGGGVSGRRRGRVRGGCPRCARAAASGRGAG